MYVKREREIKCQYYHKPCLINFSVVLSAGHMTFSQSDPSNRYIYIHKMCVLCMYLFEDAEIM